jgi:cytochrome c553
MKQKTLVLIVTLSLFSTSPSLFAKRNAASIGKEKATSCVSCHGEKGNSTMPLFPKLAAQHSSYLTKQLVAFKDGSRTDATMAPMAMGLSDEDMADIAAFYAEQKISKNDPPVLNNDDDEDNVEESGDNKRPLDMDELLKLGSDLYRNGHLERKVSACVACHGPYGEGNKPAAFPALRSQHADYLIKSLTDYKSGTRGNEDNMMRMIAEKMTDEEIRAVSYHISTKK